MTVPQGIQSQERTLVEIGVMAKYWTAGNVKTRLGASIGMQQAASIHQQFCLYLSQQLRLAGDRRSFVVSPPDSIAAFREVLPGEWPGERPGERPCAWDVQPQSIGDLGDRMKHWLGRPFAKGTVAKGVVACRILIGADCPLVDSVVINQAAEALYDHDLVLGPANDGGYYLIGVAGPWTSAHDGLMQNMPWSSERVFEVTCQRAADAGLSLETLPMMEDIDTVTELNHLRKRLLSAAPDSPQARLAIALEHALEAPNSVRPNE